MQNANYLKDLVHKFGSPLFLFYPDRLRNNIASYRRAFEAVLPRVTLAYSTKTNYVPSVIKTVAAEGVVPEAIPGLELDILDQLNLLNSQSVINGPLKTKEELQRVVEAGARINVDNITELETLNEVAASTGRKVDIGLRISGQISADSWVRFGFDIDQGDVFRAAEKTKNKLKNLRLTGLHIHLGTNILDAEIYRRGAEKACSVAREMLAKNWIDLKYLDMGGGFATNCPYWDADPETWVVPEPADYAKAISDPLVSEFGKDCPEVIIEPGRALVDSTFELLTTICRLRGNGREAIADAGQNIFSSCRYRRHGITHLDPTGRQKSRWTIFGPLCMPSDCLSRDIEMPELKPGDVLKVDFAGAYSLSQAWQFIRYQPAIVSLEDDRPTLIRRRESIENLLARDIF